MAFEGANGHISTEDGVMLYGVMLYGVSLPGCSNEAGWIKKK
jgi:hypothetical protein